MIVSVVAGLITLGLVWARRFEPARVTGAIAVAAVIAAWALARNPVLLPGLTIGQAAASHDTLVTVVVAVLAGGVLLFPSLALLFTITFRGSIRLPRGPDADGWAHRPTSRCARRRPPPGSRSCCSSSGSGCSTPPMPAGVTSSVWSRCSAS